MKLVRGWCLLPLIVMGFSGCLDDGGVDSEDGLLVVDGMVATADDDAHIRVLGWIRDASGKVMDVTSVTLHHGLVNLSDGDPALDQSMPYGNQTEAQTAMVDGEPGFVASLRVHYPGTLHVRPMVTLADGRTTWATQWAVEVLTYGSSSHLVTMDQGGPLASYLPGSLTIAVGDRVKWGNSDFLAGHTATANQGETHLFDTGILETGSASRWFTFWQPGTYTYSCRIHPDTMTGLLIVQ